MLQFFSATFLPGSGLFKKQQQRSPKLERELVEKILAGQTHLFRILIEKYQRLVSRVVFRMVSNPADREEISQEVFVRVYRNLSRFRFQSRLSTWIARIAYNTSLHFLQKQRESLYEDSPSFDSTGSETERARPPVAENIRDHRMLPDTQVERHQLQALLTREIERLPAIYRTILTLYHLEHFTYREIAQITGKPEGTVKNYLFRARQLLKERLLILYQEEELHP